MTKYLVTLEATASAYIAVEADDPEAAIEAAFEQSPGICAQCSGWGREDVGLELGEWDIPQNEDGSDADYVVTEVDA